MAGLRTGAFMQSPGSLRNLGSKFNDDELIEKFENVLSIVKTDTLSANQHEDMLDITKLISDIANFIVERDRIIH